MLQTRQNLRMRARALILFLIAFSGSGSLAFGAAVVVAKAGDASITHDASGGLWTIGAGGTTLTLELEPASDFRVHQLVTANNKPWISTVSADSTIGVNGHTRTVGRLQDDFVLLNVEATPSDTHLQLDAVFEESDDLLC